jgi:DHA1 family multidrug resistance protein-like MFS transporter
MKAQTAAPRNVYILAFVLMVVMLGYGIIMPIIPFYIDQMGASGAEMGWLTSISAIMQFIFAPLWGSLSDRLGRKPILLVGLLGYSITMLLFGLATQLWMLFAARALNGMLSSAAMPTSMAYIADSTGQEERSSGMGRLGAAAGIGMILGPGLGGALAGVSLATPFFVASAFCLGAVTLVGLLLPESLPREARKVFSRDDRSWLQTGLPESKRNRQSWLQQALPALSGPIGVLLLVTFVVSFGMAGFQNILGLYALKKLGFGPEQVGVMWMVIGGVLIVGQGALTGMLSKRWGEVAVIRFSLLVSAAGYGLVMLAHNYVGMLVTTGFFILAIALLGPALSALTSQHTPLEQGVTMGLSNASTSLGRIIGPLWSGYLFDLNLSYPFLSGGAVLLAGFLISAVWFRTSPRLAREPEPETAPAVHQ